MKTGLYRLSELPKRTPAESTAKLKTQAGPQEARTLTRRGLLSHQFLRKRVFLYYLRYLMQRLQIGCLKLRGFLGACRLGHSIGRQNLL